MNFFSEREIDLISSNIKFLTLTVEEIENTLFVFTYIILNTISYPKYLNVPPFVDEHNVFVCIIKSNKRMDGIQCINRIDTGDKSCSIGPTRLNTTTMKLLLLLIFSFSR